MTGIFTLHLICSQTTSTVKPGYEEVQGTAQILPYTQVSNKEVSIQTTSNFWSCQPLFLPLYISLRHIYNNSEV